VTLLTHFYLGDVTNILGAIW